MLRKERYEHSILYSGIYIRINDRVLYNEVFRDNEEREMSELKCPFYKTRNGSHIICMYDKLKFETQELRNTHRKTYCETMEYKQCESYTRQVDRLKK